MIRIDCVRGLPRLFASYVKETENAKREAENASERNIAEVAGTTFLFM
jgi:hypothetical protein